MFQLGVTVMTGYPGSPATGVMQAYKKLVSGQQGYQALWTINEKVALEYALGFSVAGLRTCVTVKNVGFNLIMDSLVISGLTGVNGACIIVLGDDPGSLHSSHEQDSRLLAVAAEVPLFEPSDPQRTPEIVEYAINISEQQRIPAVIRFTPSFVKAEAQVDLSKTSCLSRSKFQRSSEITNSACMPDYAVALHKRIHQVQLELTRTNLSGLEFGSGTVGLIAVGDSWQKVHTVLQRTGLDRIKILRLEQVNPLPEKTVLSFLQGLERVLVVEEVLPLAEEKIQALAQRQRICLDILGKHSKDLPGEDLLYLHDLYQAMAHLAKTDIDTEIFSEFFQDPQTWAGGTPLCQGCPYGRVYEMLHQYWQAKGLKEPALAAEPGCGVRLKYHPYDKVDIKFCMGSGSPVISALGQVFPDERPVAMIGDSAFLNSGIPGLIQACLLQARILVIIINNYSAALTGFQPTLELSPVEIKTTLINVLTSLGAAYFQSIDELNLAQLPEILDQAHAAEGPAVLLINVPCPEQEC
jgi:indolepyruvate ferredoxin oxidoreductase alpha subunit